MTDPENTTELPRADLEEVGVDEIDEESRPVPLEAEPADVVEQRREVPLEPAEDEVE